MRNAFLVAYDIADPKRLRHVYQKMRGFGDMGGEPREMVSLARLYS